MVEYLFNNDIIIYALVGLCGVGLFIRFILDMVYIHLVRESDNLGLTKNKTLRHMKLKFETCYKLKIGVNNVDTFVDKNVLRYRFCGMLLSTWENVCGQTLLLTFLVIPISTVFGVAYDCGQDVILYTGAVGILTGAVLIFVDKMINLNSKKIKIKLNLMDYLENFCKVRLEQEAFHPELLEQYRKEYFQTVESGKQIGPAKAKEEGKSELNRRKEARLRKEEEKRLAAIKREEEQKRIEQARREEEKRRQEERKRMAAQRREEELRKLEEERAALELRRLETKKKSEMKQYMTEKKKQQTQEKEQLLQSIEEEIAATKKPEEKDKLMQEIDELAAEKEKVEKEQQVKPTTKVKTKKTSEMEDKLIEDVLKEFFA